MSLRAKLLSKFLKRVAKPRWDGATSQTPIELRESVALSARYSPRSPHFVRIQPADAGGVPAEWVSVPQSRSDRAVIYLHGGLYISGAPGTHRNLTWRVAQAARAKVLVLDYRLAPEHPYPAAVNDVLSAHRWLRQQGAPRIAWCGDSAGGGLMFSAIRAARSAGLPMPRAVVAFSPWTDLAGQGPSWTENAARDPWLTTTSLMRASAHYCGALPSTHPGLSSAYADFDAPPPTLIQVGETEILRDDAHAVAARLRAAGGEVELKVWNDVPHVWQMFAPMLPESREALADTRVFFERWLGA